MKKRITKDDAEVRAPLRRTTRASNKVYVDPKYTDNVTGSHSACDLPMSEKRNIANKKKKKVKDVPDSSADLINTPSRHAPYSKNHEKCVDAGQRNPEITPKSGKSISFLERETLLKEDVFMCSQQDSNTDVLWDCSSPDALRYIQKHRRRRHVSDVSDIVQKLIVPDEEHLEDKTDTDRQSLLHVWMESCPYPSEGKNPSHAPGVHLRSGKRKDRKPQEKVSNLSKALMEKLQLALKKCEESGPSNISPIHKETKSRVKDEVQEFEESKDLFENSGELCTQSSSTEKKEDEACNINESDDSWSDDDFFKDNSLIIKATQQVEECRASPQGQPSTKKRKSSEGTPLEEPPSKTFRLSNNSDKLVSQNTLQCEKTKYPASSRYNTLQKVKVYSSVKRGTQSPFRKCRSFDDSKQKIDSITGTGSQIFGNPRPRRSPQKNIKTVPYERASISAAKSDYQPKTSILQNKDHGKNTVTSIPYATKYPLPSSRTLGNSTTTCASTLPRNTFGNSALTSNTTSSKASNCDKYHKNLDTSVNKSNVVKPDGHKKNDHKKVPSFSPNGANSRRRSAGTFDTSLSDDLLCQLADPDEILDSQTIPVNQSSAVPVKPCISATQHTSATVTSVTSTANSASKHLVKINNSSKTCEKNASCTSATSACSKISGMSSQRGKYTFKTNSLPSSEVKTTQSRDDQLDNKSTVPDKGNSATSKYSASTFQDSEDLFDSDEDQLSVPQILAFLDTVEMQATQQIKDSQAAECKNDIDKKESDSPFKCTPEEIKKKKEIALKKLHGKTDRSTSSDTEFCSQSSNSNSPFKCTPEEIEQKKIAAIEKRHGRSDSTSDSRHFDISPQKYSSNATDKILCGSQSTQAVFINSDSHSPFKCSPSEIEQKKIKALAKRRQKSGTDVCSATNHESTLGSPKKSIQEEIERKKLAALKRREERQNASRNLNSQVFTKLTSFSSKKN